eukprot:TRINITY_DN62053_c0_g1_i3.p1 TRINITY_DN62053_c0_g1~~TRINITY_DN62053_c0_g1_i3.p1  ORF type:complete len:352 (-),score=34.49 TRINITY_DN62053_c0_g1_i3:123-1148(-)
MSNPKKRTEPDTEQPTLTSFFSKKPKLSQEYDNNFKTELHQTPEKSQQQNEINNINEHKVSQKFDFFVVYDLEASCDQNRTFSPQEIIEFSGVIVDTKTLKCVQEFQRFVRPTVKPLLTPFCIKLTSIQQSDVDNAGYLSEVLQQNNLWLEENGILVEGIKFAFVTWSDWDFKVQLHQECNWREIEKPQYFNQWVDLRKEYRRHYGQSYSLPISVKSAGLEWDGHHHSGLADAKNTARLLIKMCQEGLIVNITGRFDESVSNKKVSKQQKLFSQEQASGDSQQKKQVKDASGKWICGCGIKAILRTVKKPGKNNGREFYSCGNFTMTAGSSCNFFKWKEES